MRAKNLMLFCTISGLIITTWFIFIFNTQNPFSYFIEPPHSSNESTVFIEDPSILNISAVVSPVIVFEGQIQIDIQSAMNQTLFFEFNSYFNQSSQKDITKHYFFGIGTYSIQIRIPIEFLSNIGIFEINLFGFRFHEHNSSQIVYFGYFIIQIIANPFIMVSFLFFFFVGLLIIISKKEFLEFIPRQIQKVRNNHANVLTSGVVIYRNIPCPDCRKKILEGSAFCPECGYHLALFERYLH